jgi:hypothetical protein
VVAVAVVVETDKVVEAVVPSAGTPAGNAAGAAGAAAVCSTAVAAAALAGVAVTTVAEAATGVGATSPPQATRTAAETASKPAVSTFLLIDIGTSLKHRQSRESSLLTDSDHIYKEHRDTIKIR